MMNYIDSLPSLFGCSDYFKLLSFILAADFFFFFLKEKLKLLQVVLAVDWKSVKQKVKEKQRLLWMMILNFCDRETPMI